MTGNAAAPQGAKTVSRKCLQGATKNAVVKNATQALHLTVMFYANFTFCSFSIQWQQ